MMQGGALRGNGTSGEGFASQGGRRSCDYLLSGVSFMQERIRIHAREVVLDSQA